jgi:site-specific DNA-methyltransferase (adenine-specific)
LKPYYEQDGITIYHADCSDIIPHVHPTSVDLLLTDPPYGIGVKTDYAKAGRGVPSDNSTHVGRQRKSSANTYPPVHGDDTPFDPRPLLVFGKVALFGANHFANHLPPSRSWLVWDRKSGRSATADAELIWTNLGGTVRTYRYAWNGVIRDGEKDTHGYHPTQKPVALMTWIIDRWTEPGDLIFDPYMGSGPIAQACYELGRRYVGVEIVEDYCRIAVKRLSQGVLKFE